MSVCVADSIPVAGLVAMTLALATTAPVASVTVPLKAAVDCPCALPPKTAERMIKRKARMKKLRLPIKFLNTTPIFLLLLSEYRASTVRSALNGFAIAVPQWNHVNSS